MQAQRSDYSSSCFCSDLRQLADIFSACTWSLCGPRLPITTIFYVKSASRYKPRRGLRALWYIAARRVSSLKLQARFGYYRWCIECQLKRSSLCLLRTDWSHVCRIYKILGTWATRLGPLPNFGKWPKSGVAETLKEKKDKIRGLSIMSYLHQYQL